MKKDDKTNVMRILEKNKVAYKSYTYTPDPKMTGEEIAILLHEEPSHVFKTLVAQGKTGTYYVFVIPVTQELDLKKAAKAAGEKSIAMIKQKELLPLTGYVHGGCSPIGMKKQFRTFIHETVKNYTSIFVSAGRVGCQIELDPADLINLAKCEVADIE